MEALKEHEQAMEDPAEILFRQATEPLWDAAAEQPSSHAFGPSSSDAGMPSFTRSSATTPQASRDWHNQHAKSASMGVWGCSVGAVVEASRRAVDDSADPEVQAPGHCYVDYRGLNKSEIRTVRSALLADALARGEIATAS